MDEREFAGRAETAMEALRRRLLHLADENDFDVEGGAEKVEVTFDDPEGSRFIISRNSPARQIWISALGTSFKLGWSEAAGGFALDSSGETLAQVMSRILSRQMGTDVEV